MAALPSITQVAGVHLDLYEKYFQQVDKNRTGFISALDAAGFLKKSGLSDLILSKIWDLSDPTGKGSLDKAGFCVALKLVSLAQNNKDVSMTNVSLELPAPDMGDSNSIIDSNVDWTIKVAEKVKFEQLFDSLGPVNGRLPGSKVKPVMINSKLPVEMLGQVWDLSDVDNDGFLDKEEFVLAMHLIYKALENHPVPPVLPPELVPPSKRKKSLVGAVPVLPFIPPVVDGIRRNSGVLQSSEPVAVNSASCSADVVPWVVSVVDKARYDAMFKSADLDGDGFVNGAEIKDLFLQSCLPQPVLAHIWNLCDMKQTGKLNVEQFALAMHLMQEKIRGVEPPATLPPEMVPPTLRIKSLIDETSSGDTITATTNNCFNNPELEIMSNEINDLNKEKKQMEDDVKQKESDVSIKKNEIRTLQTEFEALTSAIKQLETQRAEAQKRLDDLDGQKSSLEHSLCDLKKQVDEETEEVDRLKNQLNTQAATLKDQETELNSKRHELNELRQEESKLEQQIDASKTQLNTLCKTLENTQLQIPQAKTKILQLQDQQKQLNSLITQFDTVIENGDVSYVGDLTLQTFAPINADLDAGTKKQNGSTSSFPGADSAADGSQDDPFQSKDPFADANGFSTDPFNDDDPFKGGNDSGVVEPVDPFGGRDPFKDVFAQTINEDDFQNSDPFAALPAKTNSSNGDPFDPLGTSGTSDAVNGSDPFGSDPFAPRSESPTPALPPKKSKQPPPRPAPPKSSGIKAPRAAPPAPDPFSNGSAKTNDPFSSGFESDPFDPFTSSAGKDSFGASDQFADFANFDKLSGWGTSEEEQLAWATVESLQLEDDRRKEEADLELALALSRAEAKNVSSV